MVALSIDAGITFTMRSVSTGRSVDPVTLRSCPAVVSRMGSIMMPAATVSSGESEVAAAGDCGDCRRINVVEAEMSPFARSPFAGSPLNVETLTRYSPGPNVEVSRGHDQVFAVPEPFATVTVPVAPVNSPLPVPVWSFNEAG
jgi:hypothetical protein